MYESDDDVFNRDFFVDVRFNKLIKSNSRKWRLRLKLTSWEKFVKDFKRDSILKLNLVFKNKEFS